MTQLEIELHKIEADLANIASEMCRVRKPKVVQMLGNENGAVQRESLDDYPEDGLPDQYEDA